MDEARKREIMEAMFGAMWGQIVSRHVLPTSEGSLTVEIEQLSRDSGVPLEELTEFLKDYLDELTTMIIGREAVMALVQ